MNTKANSESIAGTVYDPNQTRRWQLHQHAQKLFWDVGPVIRDGIERCGFKHRICMCQRGTTGAEVTIKRAPNRKRAAFGGLITCGSVWVCPLCAPKVVNTRRDEMNLAISAWVRKAEVFFVTYTMQHDKETCGQGELKSALTKFAKTLSRFKGSRAVNLVKKNSGHIGTIRALEVTYGEMNGWHVHTHELMFCNSGALAEISKLKKLWARQLIKNGMSGLEAGDIGIEKFRKLRALLKRCLTVQPGDYAAEYVAKYGREPESMRGGKWGIASEMTAAHLKRGRGGQVGDDLPQRCGHVNPWGLLNDSLDGDKRSGVLFHEFGLAMKGSRQLYWSKGLKEYFFGVADRTDEEIAQDADARCTEHVITIGPISWGRVIAHRARWDLLQVAAINGREGVELFLNMLENAPPGPPTDTPFYSEQFNRMLGWNPNYAYKAAA